MRICETRSRHDRTVSRGQFAEELVNRRGDINRELKPRRRAFRRIQERRIPRPAVSIRPDPAHHRIRRNPASRKAGLKQRRERTQRLPRRQSTSRQAHHPRRRHPRQSTCTGRRLTFRKSTARTTLPAAIFAHIAGEDLVQVREDGRWWAPEDNLRIPSGASYPLFARDIERRTNPKLFRDVHARAIARRIRGPRPQVRMDFVST